MRENADSEIKCDSGIELFVGLFNLRVHNVALFITKGVNCDAILADAACDVLV